MSSDLRTFKVEELIRAGQLEIGDGYRAKNSELTDSGFPFARAGNINDGFQFDDADHFPESNLARVGSKISQPGDVVFTSKGTVGRFALVSTNTPRFVYSPQLCYWRSLDHGAILPDYLYYWMNSQEFLNQVGYLKGQTDMADYVSLRDQRRMAITVPPPARQSEVASLMKPIDDRITLLRETNATLEAIAQALFKSWFVDFDPVRAKAEGRSPDGMDEATAALFYDAPPIWERRKVSQLAEEGILEIGDGYRAKNTELGLPGVGFVRAGDLIDGRILPTRDHLSFDSAPKSSSKVARPGDTAFTSKGTIGRFAFVDDDSGGAVYSPQVCFWRVLREDVMASEYLHYWMKSDAFLSQVGAIQGQAAIMDFVSLSNQRKMVIDLPPIALQRRFGELARVALDRISVNRKIADDLASIRDTLLPRLISGQLRLAEAEPESVEAPA